MSLPLEIQEHIISLFAENSSNKELLHLRLVCRSWIPRINSHVFRCMNMKTTEEFGFLEFLKSSADDIGRHIKRLNISKGADNPFSNPFPTVHQEENDISLKTHMVELPIHLPRLETLALYHLDGSDVEWVPSFPSMKHLICRQSTIKYHQFIRLVATKSIQSIHLLDSKADFHTQAEEHVEEKESDHKFPILTHMTVYSTSFTYNHPPWMFESVLFPPATTSNPNSARSLSHLLLRAVRSDSLETIKRILQCTSESLQTLTLGFATRGTKFRIDKIRQSLDLSRHTRLEYLRVDDLTGRSSRRSCCAIENAAIMFESLPQEGKRITISLWFRDMWGDDYQPIRRMDTMLVDDYAVKSVEVYVPDPEWNYAKLATDFSLLHALDRLVIRNNGGYKPYSFVNNEI